MELVKGQPKLRLEHKKPGLQQIKWTLETQTQGVKKKEHFYLNTLYINALISAINNGNMSIID